MSKIVKEKILNHDQDLEMLIKICGHEIRRINKNIHGDIQDKILKILLEEENIPQKNLQEMIGVKPGTISETITKLEEKNLIKRIKKEDDKRHVILKITSKGKKASSTLEGTRPNLNALNKKEKDELKRLLLKLLNSWKNEDNN